MMNRCIKNSLIIYTVLATILCGMIGVTYAITATDADQYVTRSQYATDMSRLYEELDEKESTLLGTINRYRSTDVKCVTYDNPLKENTATTGNFGGKYNGGNYYPRQFWASAGSRGVPVDSIANQKTGNNANVDIYRLWNGNYLITSSLGYSDDSSYTAYPTVNFAVPCENLPGWYLECRSFWASYNYAEYLISLVKLDATVPYANPFGTFRNQVKNMDLQFRFKKEYFKYIGVTTTKWTNNKYTWTSNVPRYYGTTYNAPLSYVYHNTETSNNYSVTCNSWVDPATDDFMLTMKGLFANGPGYNTATMRITSANWLLGRLIVSDNVEYQSGNTKGYFWTSTGGNGYSCATGFPPPCYIGYGPGSYGDGYWEYEFVDCKNGIKYWHAYRKPTLTAPAGETGGGGFHPVGTHYQIPILY